MREVDAVVQQFGPGWDELRGARLFITGGTGYFGRWLLHVLQRANQSLALDMRLWVLTRSAARFVALEPELSQTPELTFLEGNILSYPLPDEMFSHIIHGAATSAEATFYGQEDPLTKFDTTVEGTRRTLELARRSHANRVLMLSSGSYYGPLGPDQSAFVEDHAVAPTRQTWVQPSATASVQQNFSAPAMQNNMDFPSPRHAAFHSWAPSSHWICTMQSEISYATHFQPPASMSPETVFRSALICTQGT